MASGWNSWKYIQGTFSILRVLSLSLQGLGGHVCTATAREYVVVSEMVVVVLARNLLHGVIEPDLSINDWSACGLR